MLEMCSENNCDCGYISKNKSVKYDEDKLAACFDFNPFCGIIHSCSIPFPFTLSWLCNYNLYYKEIFNIMPHARISMRYFFWITAFLVITGNAYVIISSVVKTSCFKQAWPSVSLQCNHIVILNIAVADFMMGIYLITISILNIVKFGSSNYNRREWIGSLGCSIVGSLALISSEASCFLMVILTAFRLYHVYQPLSSMTASSWSWKVCIFMSWSVAVFLGIFPMLETNSEYFVSDYTVKTLSGNFEILRKADIDHIACSLVGLDRSNFSNHEFISELEYINKHFSRNATQDHFNSCLKSYPTDQDFIDHQNIMEMVTSYYFIEPPKGKIGFYSAVDTCLPRFFSDPSNPGWEYSIAIITLNLTCFIFIAVSYILIYIRSTKKRPINAASTIDLQKQEAKMQKRIARIIITDFACWVPICIMAFVTFSKLSDFSVLFSEIASGFLLPINSALNPFLYSVSLSELFKRLRCQPLKKCRN